MVSGGKATAAMLGGEVSLRAVRLGRTSSEKIPTRSLRNTHGSIFSSVPGAALELKTPDVILT